jgi:hypothetical protein
MNFDAKSTTLKGFKPSPPQREEALEQTHALHPHSTFPLVR